MKYGKFQISVQFSVTRVPFDMQSTQLQRYWVIGCSKALYLPFCSRAQSLYTWQPLRAAGPGKIKDAFHRY